jgi:hypothetical protein
MTNTAPHAARMCDVNETRRMTQLAFLMHDYIFELGRKKINRIKSDAILSIHSIKAWAYHLHRFVSFLAISL